jgi:hypothetical protein
MTEKQLQRSGAIAAVGVGVLSLVYAVAYLVITPSAQRGSDTDRALRSYLDSPTGLRIAASCLLVSGLVIPVAWVALTRRLAASAPGVADLARLLGVVAGLATAAHGLADLIGLDKLAHTYASGDPAVRAAARVDVLLPASADPRGMFTFGVTGAAVLLAALLLRPQAPRLGTLGVVLGVDMMVLFVATAIGVGPLVLLTGGLASVLLGPCWWMLVARRLLQRVEPGPGANIRSEVTIPAGRGGSGKRAEQPTPNPHLA